MRFELKFAYPIHFDSQVRAWVQTHPEGFRIPYPERRINNVYFDTLDLRAFDENMAGISQRCKLRYRWYGDSLLPTAGTLEFKNKHAALGWKDSYPIAAGLLAEGEGWRAFRRNLRRALPPPGRLAFDACGEPVLINRYTRRYFESRDGRVRITLDSDQEMLDQIRGAYPNLRRRINLPAVNVLEVKCEEADHAAAVAALANCPVRGSRFSKYTIGSELRG